MTAEQLDLFGAPPAPPDPYPFGHSIKLARSFDVERPCCEHSGIGTIRRTTSMHAGKIYCAECGQFRGWLPRGATSFLRRLAEQFGVPEALPILGDDHSRIER